jgi:hypothetical protein
MAVASRMVVAEVAELPAAENARRVSSFLHHFQVVG